MRNRIQIYEPEIANIQSVKTFNVHNDAPSGLNKNSPVPEVLASEGHESLINYIERSGLSEDPVLRLSMHNTDN